MPVKIKGVSKQLVLQVHPLSQAAFAQFGTVIENPAPELLPSPTIKSLPENAVLANQGSAIKYKDVTQMLDLYASAPSGAKSEPAMSMFVCGPRALKPSTAASSPTQGQFPIEILERHPFTTQTFIPLGLSPATAADTRYLVVVAPSQAPGPQDTQLPVPPPDAVVQMGRSKAKAKSKLPGRGLPDLEGLRAFVARGDQAVTYGAGVWHAPMVVVGKRPVAFVVAQFTNGVDVEDCQEVEIVSDTGQTIVVSVPGVEEMPDRKKSRL